MAKGKSALKEIETFIVWFCRLIYDNIVWTLAIILFVNAILFISIKGGIIITIIDGVVLVFFGYRIWRERR